MGHLHFSNHPHFSSIEDGLADREAAKKTGRGYKKRKVRLSSEAKTAESYVEKPRTLAELRAEVAAGRTKATDMAASYYDRIAKVNPRLNV